MPIIETKKLTVINDEQVEPTQVQYLLFNEDYIEYEKDGVNKTLNGYNFSLSEILQDIKIQLNNELQGVKSISEMKPNTLLCCKDLDLNSDLYFETLGVDNPVITITGKDIKRANHTVQQYEYLLSIINLLLAGSNKIEKPKYELLP